MQAITLSYGQIALLAVTYALVGVVGVVVGALWVGRPRSAKPVPRTEPQDMHDEVRLLRQEVLALKANIEGDRHEPAVPVESAYSQAIKLAQQGLDSAAVAAGCGISRGEADLIVAIYRASQRP
jgi:flagellar biosynthesis/type III secretory pathway M-ring protein FliF/YscJ